MDERLKALLEDLDRAEELGPAELTKCARRAAWLGDANAGDLGEYFAGIADRPDPISAPADKLIAAGLSAATQRVRKRVSNVASNQERLPVEEAVRLYQRLEEDSVGKGQLLAWLAAAGTSESVQSLADLLVFDPPADENQIVQAIAPLFQQKTLPVDALFPRLLEALSNPSLAAPVLDLANYMTRQKLVDQHPAHGRSEQLIGLLGELTQSLARLEEQPGELADTPLELSRRVTQSVALAVSLCDALSLIGDERAIGKLTQAISLGHRRLRTEAAAALARLGSDQGTSELVALAAEPVARLRVLAYAKELGVLERIDTKYQTPESRAEAELAVWLAEPTQFGLPPPMIELIDHRRMFWPGYEEQIDCYLFRFTYVVTVADQGERTYSNIGIAGPLAHAFVADLGDLPPDDIYAAYAGWQAQHEEIREFDVARLSRSEQLEVERLKRKIHDAGYGDIDSQFMGYFFSEKVLVARATRDGSPGIAISDFQETLFFPDRHYRRPLGPQECYAIYKGRKLLKTFNH